MAIEASSMRGNVTFAAQEAGKELIVKVKELAAPVAAGVLFARAGYDWARDHRTAAVADTAVGIAVYVNHRMRTNSRIINEKEQIAVNAVYLGGRINFQRRSPESI